MEVIETFIWIGRCIAEVLFKGEGGDEGYGNENGTGTQGLLLQKLRGKLKGAVLSHVDDFNMAGDTGFGDKMVARVKKFSQYPK